MDRKCSILLFFFWGGGVQLNLQLLNQLPGHFDIGHPPVKTFKGNLLRVAVASTNQFDPEFS